MNSVTPRLTLLFLFTLTSLSYGKDGDFVTSPKRAAMVKEGTFASSLLGKEIPYRIFCPLEPKWEETKGDEHAPQGLPVAIYTVNLETTSPRPSSATDAEIFQDFIDRQFVVVAVDFSGGKVTDHFEWAKDIHGLAHVFGGSYNSSHPAFTANRREKMGIPGKHAGREITSIPSPDPSTGKEVPLHYLRIYTVPPGYTVEHYHIYNADPGPGIRRPLFFDIIYPMPAARTIKLPVLLEQSPVNQGEDVMNANTMALYPWLFNGYAFATAGNVPLREGNENSLPMLQAIRYLRWKKEKFSLNGVVSTVGISKAASRMFRESSYNGKPSPIDDLPYGRESSKVSVTMPAVGAGALLDDKIYPDFPIWENLNENSPPVVLSYNHLNPKDVEKHQGRKEKLVRDGYYAKGWKDKVLWLENPLGGHDYNIYDINQIMAWWDKWCK